MCRVGVIACECSAGGLTMTESLHVLSSDPPSIKGCLLCRAICLVSGGLGPRVWIVSNGAASPRINSLVKERNSVSLWDKHTAFLLVQTDELEALTINTCAESHCFASSFLRRGFHLKETKNLFIAMTAWCNHLSHGCGRTRAYTQRQGHIYSSNILNVSLGVYTVRSYLVCASVLACKWDMSFEGVQPLHTERQRTWGTASSQLSAARTSLHPFSSQWEKMQQLWDRNVPQTPNYIVQGQLLIIYFDTYI